MDKDTKELIVMALAKAKELCESYDYYIAETFCRQILKIEPDNEDAWFLLGICYSNMGKKVEASYAFDTASAMTSNPANKNYAMKMKEKLGDVS